MFKHEPHPDYQPAFGFYSNFPSSILISISWYCPGWNFTRSEHDIVLGIVSSIGFPFRRSTKLIFLVQITLKIDGISGITLAFQRTETAGSVRPQVDSPTSWFAYTHAGRFAYMIWRIVSVIRCPCITFNSVRRRIYMLGGHVGLDGYWPIGEVGVHLFFIILTAGLVLHT